MRLLTPLELTFKNHTTVFQFSTSDIYGIYAQGFSPYRKNQKCFYLGRADYLAEG